MNKAKFFVAGTDTGVGKTCISAGLLTAAADAGLKTIGLKPVAAGCHITDGELRNEDAELLLASSSCQLPYGQVNPIALEAPISPHLAAAREGKNISAARLMGFCRGAMMTPHNLCVVEGAGGWRVPINPRETMADFAKILDCPVILVVGMRLGCINHALLTVEAIIRDGLPLAAWVANTLDSNMDALSENIATLERLIPAPLLGRVDHIPGGDVSQIARFLDLRSLKLNH